MVRQHHRQQTFMLACHDSVLYCGTSHSGVASYCDIGHTYMMPVMLLDSLVRDLVQELLPPDYILWPSHHI